MFNGIIEEIGRIKAVRDLGGGRQLEISCKLSSTLQVDNSLCVNGVCQTVVAANAESVTVQVIEETLGKTSLGFLRPGNEVNLERSLSLSQRIDGHLVQGHVDTTGRILDVRKEGTNWLCQIGFDPQWKDLVVGRGSIAVDGISLTIAREDSRSLIVAIIPYTWEHTVIHQRKKGDPVNLEFDILGKYVINFMKNRQGEDSGRSDSAWQAGDRKSGSQSLSAGFLRDAGFE